MARTFSRPRFVELLVKTLFVSLVAAAVSRPQPAARPAQAPAPAANSQKIYVVLPFENAGAPGKLDWLSEGLEELTIERLTAAGVKRVAIPAAGKLSEERQALERTRSWKRGYRLQCGH